MEPDPYNEDEAELVYMQSKPTCFIIFGKPGAGKLSIAKKLCTAWKCIHVTIPLAIQHSVENLTNNGLQATVYLNQGEAIPDDLCLTILRERLDSDDVKNFGYCLSSFPMVSSESVIVDKQLAIIRNLSLTPDYLINLKISDADLIARLEDIKLDPIKNVRYTKAFYGKEEDHAMRNGLEKILDEVIEEEMLEDDVDDEADTFNKQEDEMNEQSFDKEELLDEAEREDERKDILARLVRTREDFDDNVLIKLNYYKEIILNKIEEYISHHNQQKVIELDANLPLQVIYRNLMTRLETFVLSRAIRPIRLQGGEDQEEIPEDTDTDDMLRSLAVSEVIAPGFRWRRSKWGKYCPVALYGGQAVSGKPEFAVSFCDKMYLMSSVENLDSFMSNPRKYLLPPQPKPPCKLVVLGPSLSGTSTLSKKLAERYSCKILDINELMKETLEEARVRLEKEQYEQLVADSISKAQVIEKNKALARKLSIDEGELDSEKQGEEDEQVEEENVESEKIDETVEVDEFHPTVQLLIEEGKKNLPLVEPVLSADEYADSLEMGFLKIYEGTNKGPSSGGWLILNFPRTKEQLNLMHDRGIVPDDVICIQDMSTDNETLLKRWNEKFRNAIFLDDGETTKSKEDEERFQKFRNSLSEFNRDWTNLKSVLRNVNGIEPILIFCDQTIEESYAIVTKKIEGVFKYRGWEYTGMDQDEEEEDFAAAAVEQDVDETDEDVNKRKPFGETLHFCPIMLKKEHVLWPGSSECAAKYRERVYFCSTPDAREEFLEDPEDYLPQEKPLNIPPVRLVLLGPKGSGKTLHGRLLAKKFGIFHISFQDRLQELILHKTQRRIGPDYENNEDDDIIENSSSENDLKHNENALENELEDEEEVPLDSIEFTEFEENIKNNIMDNEPLTEDVLQEILRPWWKDEPFKSTGFILEGFPRTSEEARCMATEGLFCDGALILAVESTEVAVRLIQPIYDKWKLKRDKRIAERKKKFHEKLEEREKERQKRKAGRMLEIEERKKERMAKQQTAIDEDNYYENDDDDEDDDDEADIDEMVEFELLEEFGDLEEDDDEEETEEEAMERLQTEIIEKYDDQMQEIEAVQEALEDAVIPRFTVDASRKPHITQYVLMKMLKSQVQFRASLFDRCQSITPQLAKNLLQTGYKQPSRFGRWCPVRLYDGDVLPPFISKEKPCCPVVYRHHIYYLSTEENRRRFIQSPQVFLQQPSPGPLVPLKIAIIGPPKSGKTFLANRFVSECGMVRLSIGSAVRQIIQTHSHMVLVKQINEYLMKGYVLPDELAIEALELCLMDTPCVTRGFVLDGYPATLNQVTLLRARGILPEKVLALTVSDKVIMQRGVEDRKSLKRVLPLHDSLTILAIRVASYRKQSMEVRKYYEEQHQNLFEINGEKSKWWIYNTALDEVQKTVASIQSYINNILLHKPSSTAGMCITPQDVACRLGPYDEYCPVSLTNDNALVDCSSFSVRNQYVAEYQKKYYKFASEENMKEFLNNPDKFVPPLAPHKLPLKEDLPKRLFDTFLKNKFPLQLTLQGYCPVTYADGNMRYEAILPGDHNLIVEYKKKFYSFATEHHLEKFMKYPSKYSSLKLPHKLPPRREPINVTALPSLGYLEQTVSNAVIKSLTAVGCFKPKYPYLSAKKSSLLYVAYHLKAYNPKSSEHVRKKYKKKLETFEDNCKLISYLSRVMKRKYLEPEDRPIDFDFKLNSFSALQSVS